jgi:hypothetical protein
MLAAALVLLIAGLSYWLGWKHRDNWDWLRALWLKKTHPDVFPDQPKSMIVEPHNETPAERAKREQDELIESLNPPR